MISEFEFADTISGSHKNNTGKINRRRKERYLLTNIE
jgi:hypothetical protein